jgi:hypothetical protein
VWGGGDKYIILELRDFHDAACCQFSMWCGSGCPKLASFLCSIVASCSRLWVSQHRGVSLHCNSGVSLHCNGFWLVLLLLLCRWRSMTL